MPPITTTTTASTRQTIQQSSLQLAQILSDLTSLRVCDPSAALALVSARAIPNDADPSQHPQLQQNEAQDPDLQRAKDLVQLHYDVRERQMRGELSRAMEEARAMVDSVGV